MENLITKLVIHISAADGYLSEVEIDKAFKELSNIYKISKEDFDKCVDQFFQEDQKIEDYLSLLKELSEPEIMLEVCYKAAASDDFDIRENFAFTKACMFFEINPDTIIKNAKTS